MNDKNRFAVVRRPASAVEKSAHGAKRILSSMVADTLELAKIEKKRKEREAYAAMLRARPDRVWEKLPPMVSVPFKTRKSLRDLEP